MTTHGGIGLVTQEGQTDGCHLCSDLVRATRVQPQCGLPETKVVHLDVDTIVTQGAAQALALMGVALQPPHSSPSSSEPPAVSPFCAPPR